MSGFFHKSCYTARSTGYKYRTLSTNTGERKRRDCIENNRFEAKFKELSKAINRRIDKEVEEIHKSRDSINEKFDKISAKIDSILDLQNTVASLQNDLVTASSKMLLISEKINKIDALSAANSFQSTRSFRSQEPIMETIEECSSIVTHI